MDHRMVRDQIINMFLWVQWMCRSFMWSFELKECLSLDLYNVWYPRKKYKNKIINKVSPVSYFNLYQGTFKIRPFFMTLIYNFFIKFTKQTWINNSTWVASWENLSWCIHKLRMHILVCAHAHSGQVMCLQCANIVWANCACLYQIEHVQRLVWAFAVHICL